MGEQLPHLGPRLMDRHHHRYLRNTRDRRERHEVEDRAGCKHLEVRTLLQAEAMLYYLPAGRERICLRFMKPT